jgi:glycosyltransferase involved in cell wall biosynthesis
LKLLLVIDHFGSGGAQRQIVELACGLQRRGHSVEMFSYFPGRGFFRSRLDEQRITVHEYEKGPGFSFAVVHKLAALIAERKIDLVISYLSSPNIYAELAKLKVPRAKLIVSERTNHRDDKSMVSAFLRRAMHGLADHVVANSESQCEWLKCKWWLKDKVSCIYNGLDPAVFAADPAIPSPGEPLRLVAVGRVGPEKNALNLVMALRIFHREWGYVPQVSWIGGRDGGSAGKHYCRQVDDLLDRSPEVRANWRWMGEAANISGLLPEYHALIHPSLYEGLPNVVCEALAAAMPVLVSNVCDHPILVAEGERGFLFDPADPHSIAAAIKKLAELGPGDWRRLSRNARQYAQESLNAEKMISAYEALIVRVLARPAGERNAIVLCGPSTELGTEGYGAGKGGYVRNVAALLAHFSSGDVKMTLSPYSTRRYSRSWKLLLPFRLFADLRVFASNIRRGGAVHVMMTYGLAIYREFGMSMIAAAFKRPVILDIRGGSFVHWLESASRLQRALAHWVLNHAEVILGQGVAVVNYLKPRYGAKVHHFPNFLQSGYLPATIQPRLRRRELKVIFVGYCYEGKGVFELVEGCARAVQKGLSLHLTLIGAESPEFQAYLDGYPIPAGLRITRCGALDFDHVQASLACHDIFCFPTRHIGEGHPNVLTEAMAHALAIVTTRHGFISELLDESSAYFLDSGSAEEVAAKLVHIDAFRDEAERKGDNARSTVQERFMESRVLGQLREHYLGALRRA